MQNETPRVAGSIRIRTRSTPSSSRFDVSAREGASSPTKSGWARPSRPVSSSRILLIVPKSLIGQWQNELLNLFGIQAREDHANFAAPGGYLVGREFAGSERGAEPLAACAPFDLVVIDEAHEIFAGLHKRYGRDGTIR